MPKATGEPRVSPQRIPERICCLVFLDQHAAATAIALLAAPEIVIDFVDVDGKARRHPVDDHGQTRTVRFSRREITQHAGYPNVIIKRRLGVGRAGACLVLSWSVSADRARVCSAVGRFSEPAASNSRCYEDDQLFKVFLPRGLFKQPAQHWNIFQDKERRYPKLELVSFSMPPITTVSPSLTSTLALASRVEFFDWEFVDRFGRNRIGNVLDLTVIFSKTKPSSETCGVTFKVIPARNLSVATAVLRRSAPSRVAELVVLIR